MLQETSDREEIIERVAALDIGKSFPVCCVRIPHESRPGRRMQEVESYPTMTRSLLAMADHLRSLGVTRVVMEATSDSWKPVFYVLEAAGFETWLVNARDVKHLPGRPKTDKLDAVWLCKVAERQMIRPSFVPPPEIRRLRDVTRCRADPVGVRGAEKNRVEKLLEDAQIKLSVVTSDIFGVSGRAMMAALIAGERSPKTLAQLAPSRMRGKNDEHWIGYKLHISETCQNPETAPPQGPGVEPARARPAAPNLITHVATTDASVPNVNLVAPIHQALARRAVLPAERYLDSGYASAAAIAAAAAQFKVSMVTPLQADVSRQTKENRGYGRDDFVVDWTTRQVTCPQGAVSRYWHPCVRSGRETIAVRFDPADCGPCPARSQCTTGKRYGRQLARRPELDKALLVTREGDQIVVTKLDRLGRSLENLIELSKGLQERGVDLVVLDQGIDTSTAVGRMFFQILSAIAEFEHALMSERTMDGLAAARARGRTGGQKPKLGPRQVQLAREMYDSGDYTVQQIADEFGVTRPTIYRHLSKFPSQPAGTE